MPTQGHILSLLASPSASWTGPGFAPSDSPCSFHCGDTPATCPLPSQGTQVGSVAVSARTTGAVLRTPSSLVPSPFSSCGSPATLLRPISGTPDVGFQPARPTQRNPRWPFKHGPQAQPVPTLCFPRKSLPSYIRSHARTHSHTTETHRHTPTGSHPPTRAPARHTTLPCTFSHMHAHTRRWRLGGASV